MHRLMFILVALALLLPGSAAAFHPTASYTYRLTRPPHSLVSVELEGVAVGPPVNGVPQSQRWTARRRVGEAGQQRTTWADSQSCAGLSRVMEAMHDLRVDNMGIRLGAPPPQVRLHAPSYAVRSALASQPGGAWASVTLIAAEGPVAAWAEAAERALASCWRATR